MFLSQASERRTILGEAEVFRFGPCPGLPDRQQVLVGLGRFAEERGLFRERKIEEDRFEGRVVIRGLQPAAGNQLLPRKAGDECLEFAVALEQFVRADLGGPGRVREIRPVLVMVAHVSWPPSVWWRGPGGARSMREIPRLPCRPPSPS